MTTQSNFSKTIQRMSYEWLCSLSHYANQFTLRYADDIILNLGVSST